MSACRSCSAEILWATTEHGKRIPLEPAGPDTVSLFVLRERGTQAVAVSPALFETEQRYQFHECPPVEGHVYDPQTAEIPY